MTVSSSYHPVDKIGVAITNEPLVRRFAFFEKKEALTSDKWLSSLTPVFFLFVRLLVRPESAGAKQESAT